MRLWDGRPEATTANAVPPLERLAADRDVLGALRFDGRGRVVSCNTTMARLLAVSAGEMSRATLTDVLERPDAAALLALVRSGRGYAAGRVQLRFVAGGRGPSVIECAVALDGGGGTLLTSPAREGRLGGPR